MRGGIIDKYSESQHTAISNLRSKTHIVNLDSVAFQIVLVVKTLLDNANAGDVRHRFDPWVGKIPWRRAWQLTPVLLPGESHGQKSLVGYSPWGHKELDMTEET